MAKRKRKGKISLDSRQVEMLESFAIDNSNRIDFATSKSDSNFGPLVRTGTYKKGYKQVSKGYSRIKGNIKKYSRILKEYYEDVDATQKKYIAMVDSIVIPQYFNVKDFKEGRVRGTLSLYKEDGKSVTVGKDTIGNIDYSGGDAVQREDLSDLTKAGPSEAEYIDTTQYMEKEYVGDITKAPTGDQAAYEESAAVQRKDLSSIEKAGGTGEPEIMQTFDEAHLVKNGLKNVNNGEVLQYANFDDNGYADSEIEDVDKDVLNGLPKEAK